MCGIRTRVIQLCTAHEYFYPYSTIHMTQTNVKKFCFLSFGCPFEISCAIYEIVFRLGDLFCGSAELRLPLKNYKNVFAAKENLFNVFSEKKVNTQITKVCINCVKIPS